MEQTGRCPDQDENCFHTFDVSTEVANYFSKILSPKIILWLINSLSFCSPTREKYKCMEDMVVINPNGTCPPIKATTIVSPPWQLPETVIVSVGGLGTTSFMDIVHDAAQLANNPNDHEDGDGLKHRFVFHKKKIWNNLFGIFTNDIFKQVV